MTKEQYVQCVSLLRDVWSKADKFMQESLEKSAFTIKVMEASHWLESYHRMNMPTQLEVGAKIVEKEQKNENAKSENGESYSSGKEETIRE